MAEFLERLHLTNCKYWYISCCGASKQKLIWIYQLKTRTNSAKNHQVGPFEKNHFFKQSSKSQIPKSSLGCFLNGFLQLWYKVTFDNVEHHVLCFVVN